MLKGQTQKKTRTLPSPDHVLKPPESPKNVSQGLQPLGHERAKKESDFYAFQPHLRWLFLDFEGSQGLEATNREELK